MAGLTIITIAVLVALIGALAWSGRRTPTTLAAGVVFAGLLTLRPALLGEFLGPLGAVPLGAALLLVWRLEVRGVPGHQWIALAGCLIYPPLVAGAFTANTLSGIVVSPIVAAAGWVMGRDERAIERFVRLGVVVAVHQVVALLVSVWLDLPVWLYTPSGSDREGFVYEISRLGSISTGTGGVGTVIDQRLTGPFGEPGVFAAFLVIVAAVHLGVRQRWMWRVQIPLAAGVLLTQSAAGFGVYGVTVIVYITFAVRARRTAPFRLRHYLALAAGMFFALRAAANPAGILAVKAEANERSFSDRLAGTDPATLASTWSANPLGVDRVGIGAGINLLQTSITYGPAILVLGAWLYLAPLRGRFPRRAAAPIAAVALTVLFAQPPFLYLWIFFAFLTSGLTTIETEPAARRWRRRRTSQRIPYRTRVRV